MEGRKTDEGTKKHWAPDGEGIRRRESQAKGLGLWKEKGNKKRDSEDGQGGDNTPYGTLAARERKAS